MYIQICGQVNLVEICRKYVEKNLFLPKNSVIAKQQQSS